jgi:hypothetical protein
MNKFSKTPPKTAEDFVGGAPVQTVETPPATPLPAALQKPVPDIEAKGEGTYRAVTLRLDKDRYKRIKMKATVEETSIQQILIDALDRHLVADSREG